MSVFEIPTLIDCIWRAFLLAQASNWKRMGDRFGANAGLDFGSLLIMLGVCVAAGLAVWGMQFLARRWESQASQPNPQRLHREICRAHGLTGRQASLTRSIAEAAQLPQPADVFVRPDLFAIRALPEALVDRAGEVEEIAADLFSDLRVKQRGGKANAPGANG